MYKNVAKQNPGAIGQEICHLLQLSKLEIVRRWQRGSKISSRPRRHFKTEKWRKPLHTIFKVFYSGKFMVGDQKEGRPGGTWPFYAPILCCYSSPSPDLKLQLSWSFHGVKVIGYMFKVDSSVCLSSLPVYLKWSLCESLQGRSEQAFPHSSQVTIASMGPRPCREGRKSLRRQK